jgi:hypothetical protein
MHKRQQKGRIEKDTGDEDEIEIEGGIKWRPETKWRPRGQP